MKLLAGLLLSIALLTTPACGKTIRGEFVIDPADSTLRAAWAEALKLAEVPPNWSNPPMVLRIQARNVNGPERELGRYIWYIELDKYGAPLIKEQIFIFLTVNEDEHLQAVLVHEFLHAMYQRKTLYVPGFQDANPDSETWVCSLGACGLRGSQ